MKRFFITIKNPADTGRLDKIIAEKLPEISRGRVRKLIESGAVSIDGKRVRRQSKQVETGQTITIYDLPGHPHSASGTSSIITIHDDPWYVVVVKPSGMPADETPAGISGTLTGILSQKFADKTVQTVHRLDMGTSGIMVVSKTPAATRALGRQFQQRQVDKRYAALVHGCPAATGGRIETQIDRDPADPRKFRSTPDGGRQAVTEYRVVTRFPRHALLDLEIHTGRTHQIRVHLSEAGHPVAGDALYGRHDDGAPRLMLHAVSLSFVCPRTGRKMTFTDPVPDIFTVYAGAGQS